MGLQWVRKDQEVITKGLASPDYTLQPKDLQRAAASARFMLLLSQMSPEFTSTQIIAARQTMEVLPVLLAALGELPKEDA